MAQPISPFAEDDLVPRSGRGLTWRDMLGLAAAVPLRSALAWGVSVGLIAMVIFYGLSRVALYRDLARGRERVVQAFARGDLADPLSAYGNTIIGSHQFNDCLILGLALY